MNDSKELLDLVERQENSVVPLYFLDSREAPQQYATAILFRVRRSLFLLSAAHVLFEFIRRPIFAPMAGDFYPIAGIPKLTRWTQSPYDIGFLLLSRRSAQLILSRYRPLDVEELDLEHLTREKELEYLIFGFPASQSKARTDTKHVTSHLKSIEVAASKLNEYNVQKRSPRTHLIIDFPKKFGKGFFSPKVQGMSGGPVYHVQGLQSHNPSHLQLKVVALLCSHPDNLREYDTHYPIVAARIDLFTAFLRHSFPSLRKSIPPSRVMGP